MSEGVVTICGFVAGAPKKGWTPRERLTATFRLRTTPTVATGAQAADGEPFISEVFTSGALAEGVLTKVTDGDRVIVQGRFGARRGQVSIYAVIVGLDMRCAPVVRDLESA